MSALTGDDIINFFDGKMKILLYSDLLKYDNIDEVLSPYGKCCILYFWKRNPDNSVWGHWVAIRKGKRPMTIEIFNSYGDWIDKNLDKIPYLFKKENKEDFKQLSYLLYKSPYIIHYNENQYQDNNSKVCGYWCVYFLKRDDLNLEQFQNLWDKKNFKQNDKKLLKLLN